MHRGSVVGTQLSGSTGCTHSALALDKEEGCTACYSDQKLLRTIVAIVAQSMNPTTSSPPLAVSYHNLTLKRYLVEERSMADNFDYHTYFARKAR